MESSDRADFDRLPDGVEVEHEPTIAYLPPGPVQEEALSEGLVHGAFGFAVVFQRGPRAGMAYILAPGKTTVGRGPENDVFLDDVTVSRHHGAFYVGEGRLSVHDNGSTNGTYVNGQQVDDAELMPGDEVILGKYHLIVARGDG